MSARTALVTGITGQDGSYLAKLLLDRGYSVVGAFRRNSTTNNWRLGELGVEDKIAFVDFELAEFSNIHNAIRNVRPSVIFNLAAQSFVASSFNQPIYTTDINALGVTRLLESIRLVDPGIRYYQASTSEMYGATQQRPQSELTPFYPRSPYGVAKLCAHWMTINYRESYGLHASCGILFNHESPMRGREFITRKVTSHLALYAAGRKKPMVLGNLEARRDWGHARDYVQGMLAMTEAEKPDDYVLATSTTHSVREFVEAATRVAGYEIAWEGEGAGELGRIRATGEVLIEVSPKFYRPAEVDYLLGDPSKAQRQLGWSQSTTFEALVEEMVRADRDRVARNQPLV